MMRYATAAVVVFLLLLGSSDVQAQSNRQLVQRNLLLMAQAQDRYRQANSIYANDPNLLVPYGWQPDRRLDVKILQADADSWRAQGKRRNTARIWVYDSATGGFE